MANSSGNSFRPEPPLPGTRIVVDFSDPAIGPPGFAARRWIPIGDRIMGGVSTGMMQDGGQGTAIFAGTVSVALGGGFASVRSESAPCDLSNHAGLRLHLAGDGKRYKLNLRCDDDFDGTQYQSAFGTRGGWEAIDLPFDRFVAVYRGQTVEGADPFDPARLISLGLVIGDRQEGSFRLELARIEAI